MTIDELKAIPFHFVCSAAWEDEHTLTHESEDGRLGYCDHTPKRKNGDFGKSYRHWHIDGKVYKKKEKFIAALADFNPNVLPINHRPYQNTVARMKHERDATAIARLMREMGDWLAQHHYNVAMPPVAFCIQQTDDDTAQYLERGKYPRFRVIIDDSFLHIDEIPVTSDERELLIKAELLCRKLLVNDNGYIDSMIIER